MRYLFASVLTVLVAGQVQAWNATGHETVAAIAWENMTPKARSATVALLHKAPDKACLQELFPADSRPLEARNREFFIKASTWPDVVRPDKHDTRPCTRFHQRDWHFVDYFWEGTSGSTSTPPKDRTDLKIAAVNAVERLGYFRPLVACTTAACGTPDDVRATTLAWIVHLVGDIHQPLHTSGHVTTQAEERTGDQGGNLFQLAPKHALHSFWDDIVDTSIQRHHDETTLAYVTRVATLITAAHPRASLAGSMESGEFEKWSKESLLVAKNTAYPKQLQRNHEPSDNYRQTAFTAAERSIALGGYRLADLMNAMFN